MSDPPVASHRVTSITLYSCDTGSVSLEILGAIHQRKSGVAAAYGVALTVPGTGAFLLAERSRPIT